MRRWGTGIAAVLLMFLGGLLGPLGTGAVESQAGETTIVVEHSEHLLAAYDYTVRVVGPDGAPVSGAGVTGTPVGPDGSIGRITTLEPIDQDGRYRGIVEMPAPGTWTVRFAVADPVANLEHVQEMALPGELPTAPAPAPAPPEAPAAEEQQQPSSETQTGNGETEQPTGEAPASAAPDQAAADADTGGESSAVPTLLAISAAVLILAFGTAVVITRRRREAAEQDPNTKEDPLRALEDEIEAEADDSDDSDDKEDDDAAPAEVGS